MTSIGSYAFIGCSNLSKVYCYAKTTPSTGAKTFDSPNIENATLHVPASALEAYKTTTPWSSFGNIVALTDEEMGINELTNDDAQTEIYDLSGRLVEKADKGIYIINGRKVVIK